MTFVSWNYRIHFDWLYKDSITGTITIWPFTICLLHEIIVKDPSDLLYHRKLRDCTAAVFSLRVLHAMFTISGPWRTMTADAVLILLTEAVKYPGSWLSECRPASSLSIVSWVTFISCLHKTLSSSVIDRHQLLSSVTVIKCYRPPSAANGTRTWHIIIQNIQL